MNRSCLLSGPYRIPALSLGASSGSHLSRLRERRGPHMPPCPLKYLLRTFCRFPVMLSLAFII
jgi:hypothetical protein